MTYALYFPSQRGAWEHELYLEFAAYLERLGLLAGMTTVETLALASRLRPPQRFRLHHSQLVVRHSKGRRFIVLDCHDWVTPFESATETLARTHSCTRILKAQYRREPYDTGPLRKIRPWTYFPTHPMRLQALVSELPAPRVVHDTLFFRGNTQWAQRHQVLATLADQGLVTADYGRWVGYEEYLRELTGHRVALALPGMGNLCHREIEAFAVGVPVLMPRLRNELHDPLVPDRHYISVDADVENDHPARIAGALAERFREIRGRPDQLRRVAANARAWYERNARLPDAFELTLRLADLT